MHLLEKMPPGPIPRKWIGQAKKHANFIAKENGWTGKLWAVRGKVLPVKNRGHQLNVFQYILDHADEGAWVWDFRKEEAESTDEAPGTAVPGRSESPGTAVHGAPAEGP